MGCASSQPEGQPADSATGRKYAQSYAVTVGGGGAKPAKPAADPHLQVLFFPDKALPCRNYSSPGGCRRHNCTYAHEPTNLSRLLAVLGSATKTVEVCVFSITCNEIADALLELHRRGVRVRVISDNDQMASTGSDVQRLKDAGLQVKVDTSKFHMHNKFAIIDSKVLINGSFNWSRQAVLGNNENIVIQSLPQLVQTFSRYFESLWSSAAFRSV